jgi:L-ribulokinase
MTTLKAKRFDPRPAARAVYDELYGIYRELHDAFGLPAAAVAKADRVGGSRPELATLMKRLLALKERTVVDPA